MLAISLLPIVWSIFLVVFAAAFQNATADAAATCKAHPTRPDWPSRADWSALNTLIGGGLLEPAPLAAACHRTHPSYNAARCTNIKANWASSEFHAHHPTSSLWTNVNGYSCEITDTARDCTTAGFPVYVINATDSRQVGLAVQWANKNNVRVSVKSTGHDFLGRSTQPYSLSIWVHYLQRRVYHAEGFRPEGCGFEIKGPAVSAGGGTQMEKLNHFVNGHGTSVIHGNSNTVSVGGYVSGGGHSTLSGLYGLAADAVLEVEMVGPTGEVFIANECQNKDLFWAVRGGGGGTWGVMMRVTMRAFPSVGQATWRGTIHGPAGSNRSWAAISAFHSAWAKYLAPAGATGYVTGHAWREGKVTVQIYLPGARTEGELTTIMTSVERQTRAAGGEMSGVGTYRARAASRPGSPMTANDGPSMSATGSRTFPGNGQNKIVASWLYGARELNSPKLQTALMGASDTDSMIYQDFTGGPGCAKPPFMRGGGNSVGQGWRTALVRPAAELQWQGDNENTLAKRKAAAIKFTQSLASLNPDMGMYVNEADPETEGIQKAFWGENYARLLSIKRRMDPSGVFWCKQCVGGEEWQYYQGGVLCKR
ncbi:FAD-binding domain-containing protein [Microthyrium microscopicum]|uniref:FAD-binding domain-containing protein n=1 Tax=Microthyrium microscopicum TaxID=703497 RepID=A0A6A6TW69_9PEZI|nr:FAD-binding domain-containing protein [Microthyrium microscopicum]